MLISFSAGIKNSLVSARLNAQLSEKQGGISDENLTGFATIDTHTGDEPTRTVIGVLPYFPGDTVAQKMLYLKERMDWISTSLMFEPRGHSVMSGVILTEPKNPQAGIGVIFIETGGYSDYFVDLDADH